MVAFSEEKCLWCNRSDGELVTVEVPVTDRLGRNPRPEPVTVHPHHAPPTREFLAFVARHAKTFVVGMMSGTVVAVTLAVLVTTALVDVGPGEDYWAGVLLGPYVLLTGLFIVRFPFSTPETVKWLGLESSRRLGRALGWLCAGLGGWILLATLT